MNDDTSTNEQAIIAEALRRMKSRKPSIPGDKVQAFLAKLQIELNQANALTDEQIRERFQRFVAEASHVSS